MDQLLEYRNLVDPIQERIASNMSAAVGFAQAAVTTAFLLNGGALLAIPAFWAMVPNNKAENGDVAPGKPIEFQAMMESSEWFLWGLVAAVIATMLAYLNFSLAAASNSNSIAATVDTLNEKYCPKQGLPKEQWSKCSKLVNNIGFYATFCFALLCWVATFAFFYFGAHHMLLQFGKL